MFLPIHSIPAILPFPAHIYRKEVGRIGIRSRGSSGGPVCVYNTFHMTDTQLPGRNGITYNVPIRFDAFYNPSVLV